MCGFVPGSGNAGSPKQRFWLHQTQQLLAQHRLLISKNRMLIPLCLAFRISANPKWKTAQEGCTSCKSIPIGRLHGRKWKGVHLGLFVQTRLDKYSVTLKSLFMGVGVFICTWHMHIFQNVESHHRWHFSSNNFKTGWLWWQKPEVPALGRLRQDVNLKAIVGCGRYLVRLCLKSQTKTTTTKESSRKPFYKFFFFVSLKLYVWIQSHTASS